MSTELNRIAELARTDRDRQFLSIAHLITPESLHRAFKRSRKDASAGVDGITHAEYGTKVIENIKNLHERLKGQRYRAQPLRRVHIPKEDGKTRPLSIPALEDKIVQKATAEILEAIYEQDFMPFSYGFRPGRGQHDALDEIGRIICQRPIAYVLEADICGYFDAIVRERLMEMIERRVKDGSIHRLIAKWINAGIIENGGLLVAETGVGQGQPISPLLANIYLHYVLDEWFVNEVRPRLKGEAHLVRFADDFLLCFQHRDDAEKVQEVLHKRFAKFGLNLHPEKTRLLKFGRQAMSDWERGGVRPATFDFLGFTHLCARSRRGRFTIHVQTMRKRIKRSLQRISDWCKAHRHDPVEKQWQALCKKLDGHYNYYGRPTNYRSLWRFFRCVRRIWKTWLNSRTRGKTLNWEKFGRLLDRLPLSRPRITRAWAK